MHYNFIYLLLETAFLADILGKTVYVNKCLFLKQTDSHVYSL